MNYNFKNKNIFITGSSSGLGFEIAKFFHNENANVILNGTNIDKLKESSKQLNDAGYFHGDISCEKTTEKLYNAIKKNYKKINVLICNVGSGKSVPPGEENINEWRRVFELNFWSTLNTIYYFSKILDTNNNSSIICISSICGLERIKGAPITYSVAKSAINSFVNSYAPVLGKRGIRINAIIPGNLMFQDSSWKEKLKNNRDEVKDMLNKEVPLKIFGSGEEIAKTIGFLVSEHSMFTTGSLWKIDGGQVRKFN